MKNRRKHFLIDKGLQLRYVLYTALTLSIVCAAGISGTYFGVWGSVLHSFSEEEVRDTMITAARIYEYKQARQPSKDVLSIPSIRMFQETVLLSERQKEIIQQILDETHRRLIPLGIALILLIGWGSIYLTHKIAGPLFRFRKTFEDVAQLNLTVRIRLRRHDQAQLVAREFNTMISELDKRIGHLKQLAQSGAHSQTIERIQLELEPFKTSPPSS